MIEAATRSLTSTQVPVAAVATAVTTTPQTNHMIRNHGTPGIASSRWVITQARPNPANQEPARTKSSSGDSLPRESRGTGGAASTSYDGRKVLTPSGSAGVPGRPASGRLSRVVISRCPPRSGCG